MIYFVACREADAVKIGICSARVHKRVSMLQVGCPLRLELMGVQDGYTEEERELLKRFAAHRIHGEWFRLTDEIREYAATLSMPAPPVRPARSEKLVRQWCAA
jgi:hypothetical protein